MCSDQIALLALGVLAGCSQGKPCTLIGGPSTITIDVGRILADHQGEVLARLCVETTCDSTSKQDARQLDVLFVDDSSQPNGPDHEPTKYAAALVATEQGALEVAAS